MTTRRLLIAAAVVIVLSLGIVLLGGAAWSGVRDKPAAGVPAGPGNDAAERARAALVSQLGVAPEQIKVEATEAHTWNDASLGLPEEGMMYAQVITDGYIVTLSHAGKQYVYHVAGETVKLDPNG